MTDILTWMHNIGIAILTILISVAIFIIQDKQRFAWDDLVILDKVIEARRLLVALVCIFVPVLFWEDNTGLNWAHAGISGLFLFGVLYCTKILVNSYKWIRTIETEDLPGQKNYRAELRLQCLREITDSEEKKKIWFLTWGQEIKDLQEELTLLDIFLKELEQLQADKPKEFYALLSIFMSCLSKRRIADWRVFDLLLPKLLAWHYKIAVERYSFKENPPANFGLVLETQHVLEECVSQFVVAGLKGSSSYPLFEVLKKHVEPISEKASKAADKGAARYLDGFFSLLVPVLFENIGTSMESYDIWSQFFPGNWKITPETLKSSIVPRILWGDFWRWSRERIMRPVSDYDVSLETVSRELFPRTDPIIWADILRFLCLPWVNDDRMGSILKTKRNFGLIGRVSATFAAEWTAEIDISKELIFDEGLFDETIELALMVGGNEFSEENLKKYLTELEKFPNDPHAASYKAIFEKMQQKHAKPKNENKGQGLRH